MGLLAACSVLICCFGILLGRNFGPPMGPDNGKAPGEVNAKASQTVAQAQRS